MPPTDLATRSDTDGLGRDDLLGQIRERIVRFAASRLGRESAEDLAQDVLILLSTKYADKTAIEDMMPLAFRMIRLKMLAHRRKAVRRGEYTQSDIEAVDASGQHAQAETPEDEAARRQWRARLIQAAGRLTGRCRELFRLKVEGQPFAAIQAALGAASINTVYTWDARCRESLRRLMGGSWEL